jgi:GT2 family glycosyltransferase
MTVSIVSVLYGKRALTERYLGLLEEALGPRLGADVEVVLVDNASPDDTGALLDAWADRITAVRLPVNRNFSGGNNAGVAIARGDVVLLLNNDTEPTAAAIDALAAQVREPDVGIAGCRLLYPDGTIQHGGMAWWRHKDGPVRSFHLFRHEPGSLPAARAVFDTDVVTGACLAIRREVYERLGGLDEAYRNGWEDTDLCLRVRSSGLRVVYRGDVKMIHAEGGTRGRNADERDNEIVFQTAWGSLLDDDVETLGRLFDGCFNPRLASPVYLADDPWGSRVSVEGQITTLSPDAAEARALIAALEADGLDPAARERHDTWVAPRLAPEEWNVVLRAHGRRRGTGAPVVSVGGAGAAHVVRCATIPAVIPAGAAVWATHARLADELVRAGLDPARIDVVPPPLPELPAGRGGAGLLVLLPVGEPEAAAGLLRTAAASGMPVRLLPAASDLVLERLAAELAPHAELLSPVASETAFALLAGASDAVASGGAGDPFQRRALIAAAVGTPVVAAAGGPAASVAADSLAAALDRGRSVTSLEAPSLVELVAAAGLRVERLAA